MSYSTQTTIENKVKASRIRLWGDRDRDSVLDPGTLAAALKQAKAKIDAMLCRRFGTQVYAWTYSTVPEVLHDISDDLVLYYFASGSNQMSPQIKTNRDLSWELLLFIARGDMDIFDPSGNIVTESAESYAETISSAEDIDRVFPDDILDEVAPTVMAGVESE